ncbi:MAG: transcription termination/antitermination factor NusG [Kiritimatiellae bacterium]|nr:transcription termination/antitermination factor NusG [Kiritimatiellia bacterium]
MEVRQEDTELDLESIHRPDMQWFVVHTLTGQEGKAQKYLQSQIRNAEMGALIGDVRMPTEKVTETKNGKKTTTTRKFFPGYLLVQAAVYSVPDPSKPRRRVLNTECWRFINDTPGIISFLGGDHPIPLTDREVDDIFAQTDEQKAARPKVTYEPGEVVTILEGAFKGSSGPIDEVDPDRGRLKVTVTIFGRPVSVELEYWQVERQQAPAAPGVNG